MIKFFIMADPELPVLAYNMTKFMNGVQRNGGIVLSSNVIRDVKPLLTGIVFYSETKRERISSTSSSSSSSSANNSQVFGLEDDDDDVETHRFELKLD